MICWHELAMVILELSTTYLVLEAGVQEGEAGRAALLPGLRAALGEFLEALKSFSAASLPSEMRLAAVTALQSSACLTALPTPVQQQPCTSAPGARASLPRPRVSMQMSVRCTSEHLSKTGFVRSAV